jgi:hypothetical protein
LGTLRGVIPGAPWFIRNRLRARFTGGFRINPFFDMATDRPIAAPKVLSPAERDGLRMPVAADAEGRL